MSTEYQKARTAAGLSQEQAAAALLIDRAKLSRIETGTQRPTDQEVVAMSKLYRAPKLCNTYCVDCCEIGHLLFRAVNAGDLDRVSLQLLGILGQTDKLQKEIIRIAADGNVDGSEQEAFRRVVGQMDQLIDAALAIKLWAMQHIRENGT